MNSTRYRELLEKYLSNALSQPEQEELLLISGQHQVDLEAVIDEALEEERFKGEENEPLRDLIFQKLENKMDNVVPMRRSKLIRLRRIAAAAVLVFVVSGLWWVLRDKTSTGPGVEKNIVRDVAPPSGNHATITLANGQKIIIDSAANGTLAQQENVKVVKLSDGQIAYEGGVSSTVSYNTLTNPRGSNIISLTLADGSKVWLNAESSLRYPTAFTGNERSVEITGEAYFEVVHDAAKPFYVSKGDMQVRVLGTQFNVNAYDDEKTINVTLVEGSVSVKHGADSEVLKPGQQAIVAGNQVSTKNDVDLLAVMAWKNGLFNFSGASLQEMMRQLARWYDVEIEYRGMIPARKFGGEMQRDLNLSEVLEGLNHIGVRFTIEGRKLIVGDF